MKKQIVSALLLMASLTATTTTSHAQNLLDKMNKFAGSADTLGKWDADGYVIDGEGSLTGLDSVARPGTVKFIVADRNKDMDFIWFTPESEMKPQKIKYKEVVSFTVKGKQFYPVRIKEDDIDIGHGRIFMEMLNSSTSDNFKMYMLRKLEPNTSHIGNNAYDLKRGFYVILPEFKNAHEIVDMVFTPFAKKMSAFLKDCPELSKKIADKETGYKVSMFNGAASDEVYLRIMKEYNDCAKQPQPAQ